MGQGIKIKHLRWWIAGMIALATAINYLDRQTLPVALGELRKSFPISDAEYGAINSLFLLAYGTMYAVGGRLLDKLGARTGYAVMIIWWSIANMLHGLVSGVLGLGVARFLLGLGEGGGFPGSAKAVSEWFPVKERAFAFGIFNTGSSLGAVVAPPLIAAVIAAFDWRWAFILTGLVGLVWAVAWLTVYASPARSRLITDQERSEVLAALGNTDGGSGPGMVWRQLFRYRPIWGLLIMKFLTDAGWFFFIFWLPKYLNDVRGLDIAAIGRYAWVPYTFAGVGSLFSGWGSSFLLRRQVSLHLARWIPMAVSACLLPVSLLIADAPLGMAILLFGLAMLGHQSWSTIVQTLAADLFPSRLVGSVSGLMGCVGTYGAMLFSLVIGFVIEHYSYTPAFIIAGVLHPVSLLVGFALIGRIAPIRLTHQS